MFIFTIIMIIKLGKDSSTSPPQVLAMADIMAGTTLEDLEYSDEESEMDSDEDDVNQVKYDKVLNKIKMNNRLQQLKCTDGDNIVIFFMLN